MRHFLPAAAILTSLAGHALAQNDQRSPAELRKEVERLDAENDRLVDQRRELLDQIRLLEERIAQLEAQVRAAESRESALREGMGPIDTGSPPPGPRAEIPNDPLAAPASMLKYLRERYHDEVASTPHETEDDRERYVRRVHDWIAMTNREIRGRVEWLIEITEIISPPNSPTTGMISVLDPDTLLPIGDPYRAVIPQRFVRRVASAAEQRNRMPDESAWELQLIVSADSRFADERLAAGPFDYPRLVGRYVEFDYDTNWQTLRPFDLEEARAELERKRRAAQQGNQPPSSVGDVEGSDGVDPNLQPRNNNRD